MSLPLALDTNVLVRLLTNDDPEQAERAAHLIDRSSACFVPITVTLELEWVLRGAYRLSPEAVISAFEGLMAIPQVHLEHDDQVLYALEWHRQGLDFADSLHLARCAAGLGITPFVEEP
ncbi:MULTISPECIES: type II toxin-antitoxin system VapC family toxin [unclassified Synechococcus]|uniref:type II toxin-antitoxin system VapC family toxin n=1 Tax=unclassified Synechococcus TaxID=2626047 RepID=UPI00006993E4|nr:MULTISPECIES: type II toxin-antitoxin system VapC family toxin [unclassified Synechococcus]EAQ75945.1 PilT protein-like [Synechococcus sp. WH 5701]WFN58676.1 type II toxin-antitoxin system VapC family toxin [Synechococcus sp. CCFWC 502]